MSVQQPSGAVVSLVTGTVADQVFSPDGKTLYTARNGTVTAYDVATGDVGSSWTIGQQLGGMDVSTDGKYLVATEIKSGPSTQSGGNYSTDYYVYRLDLTTGAVTTYTNHASNGDSNFYDASFLPNGTVLLTQNFSGSGWEPLTTLDPVSGTFAKSSQQYAQDGTLTASPDRHHLAFMPSNISDDPVFVYTAGVGVTASHQNYADGVMGYNNGVQAISPDGTMIVQGAGLNVYDGNLHYAGTLTTRYPQFGNAIDGIAFSPDSSKLYLLDANAREVFVLNAKTWDVLGGYAVGTAIAQGNGHYGDALTISADGHTLSVIGADTIQLIHLDKAVNDAGTAGNDVLVGDANANTIYGFDGNDSLDGGAGADHLYGGAGDDSYYVDNTGDVVTEYPNGGNDTVYSSVTYTIPSFVETLTLTGTAAIDAYGSSAADTLIGNDAANHLVGNDGDDTLIGGGGADRLEGGTGNDSYYVDNVGDVVIEAAYQGADTVYSSVTYTMPANVEKLVLTGTAAIDATGSAAADTLIGNAAANHLVGLDGDDTLIGGGGNDVLDGGAGNDKLTGGMGDDTLIGGDGDDVITVGGGHDLVDGGAGNDTLVLAGTRASYGVVTGNGQATFTGADGTVQVSNVEQVKFADTTVSFAEAIASATLTAPASVTESAGASVPLTLTLHHAAGTAGTVTVSLEATATAIDGTSVTTPAHSVSYAVPASATGDYAIDLSSITGLDDLIAAATAPSPPRPGATATGSTTGAAPSAVIVQSGDSIGASVGIYPAIEHLGLPASVAVHNVSANGMTQQAAYDGRATDLFPLVDPGAASVLVIEEGTNDLVSGTTGTDLYNNVLRPFVASAEAAGFYVVVDTLLPREDFLWTPAEEQERLTYNQLVRANTAGADAINDVAADPIIGDGTHPATSVYYIDHLHPSAAGQQRLAVLDAEALAPFVQPAAPSAVTLTVTASGQTFANGTDSTVLTVPLVGADHPGTTGNDVIAVSNAHPSFTGNGGNDTFQGAAAQLAGTYITDFSVGDRIAVTDAGYAGFAFQRTGATLSFNGATLTLGTANPHLVTAADPAGGVDLLAANHVAGLSDINGDGHSDLIWRNDDGTLTSWDVTGNAAGNQFAENTTHVSGVTPDWQMAETFDWNGDGHADLLWRNAGTGQFSVWTGGNDSWTPNAFFQSGVGADWSIAGTGDLNGDGRDDIVWRNGVTGSFTTWLSTGTGFQQNAYSDNSVGTDWKLVGLGDFDGDGKADLLWRNASTGMFTEWRSTGNGFTHNVYVDGSVDTSWHIDAIADVNGDGKDDLLWRHDGDGAFTVWQGTATGFTPNTYANNTVTPDWQVATTGDYNDDGKADLVWRNGTNGDLTIWQSTGQGFTPNIASVNGVTTDWHIQGHSIQHG